jgi:hypothetical protein
VYISIGYQLSHSEVENMRTQRRSSSRVLFSVLTAMIAVAAGAAAAQESKPTPVQASMRGMFVSLAKVYGYSLDAEAFADPANRQEIVSTLEALAKNADQLEAHGGGLDPSFDFMRRSLSRDAHDALERFQSANYVGSRFVLSKITENCVTCHTKLPAERKFDLGKEFLDAVEADKLPPTSRATLQVATRQFSDAMKTYESILSSSRVTGADLVMFDVFENYLRISIGAMNDIKRPTETLKEFVRRPDMPEDVKADARAWIGSLETLNLNAPKGEDLATARRMVDEAMKKTKSRSDRSRLVDFIGSITLVHRYLRSKPQNTLDVAEAYYLLGVAESYVAHSYWISETDYLLEKAIRLAPKSDVAKQAFAFLEDYTHSEYKVAPARSVPPELQTNLEELRKLTEQ